MQCSGFDRSFCDPSANNLCESTKFSVRLSLEIGQEMPILEEIILEVSSYLELCTDSSPIFFYHSRIVHISDF